MATWADEDLAIGERVKGVQRPKRGDEQLIVTPGTKIFMRPRSMRLVKESYIEAEFEISDLASQVMRLMIV